MQLTEILIQEYNNLWNEKLIHKQSIRKFHNYLTYMTAIASLALTFHGVSKEDYFLIGANPEATAQAFAQAKHIINMIFVPFTPVVIVTLTFPINDIFHTYAIGTQISEIEKKINQLNGNDLLVWEHSICPIVYGGVMPAGKRKVDNLIAKGDVLLLIPALLVISGVATYLGFCFLFDEVNQLISYVYLLIVIYMAGSLIHLGSRVREYTKSDGNLKENIMDANYTIYSD